MLRVQGWLLIVCAAFCAAGEAAPLGEAGLAALAAARAQVKAVAGTGIETVQRSDQADRPGEPSQIVFAIAEGGRYSIVITDPKDPDGARTCFVCDGQQACEISKISVDDSDPIRKWRPAAQDLLQRMLACLRLDLAALRAEYTVELKAADGGLRELRLVPTSPELAREISAVGVLIDGAGKPVRVLLDETSGNRRRLEISAFNDDPPLDPERFRVPARP